MDLLERLVQADVDAAYTLKRETFKSKRLAEVIGEPEVEITIKEIPQRKLNEIYARSYSSNGKFSLEKSFDSKIMAIVEGVQTPDLRNKELREHFKAETPAKLAEVLFGYEITDLSDAIMKLSGVDEDVDKELKN